MLSIGKPICHVPRRDRGLLCTGSLPAVQQPRGSAAHQPPPAKGKSTAHFLQREERFKKYLPTCRKEQLLSTVLPVAGNQILPDSSTQTLASPCDSSSTHEWGIRAQKLITRGCLQLLFLLRATASCQVCKVWPTPQDTHILQRCWLLIWVCASRAWSAEAVSPCDGDDIEPWQFSQGTRAVRMCPFVSYTIPNHEGRVVYCLEGTYYWPPTVYWAEVDALPLITALSCCFLPPKAPSSCTQLLWT